MKKVPKSDAARQRPTARAMRKQLIDRLPDMLDAAIAAYQRIALSSHSNDPKSFVATHSGAKAALAHIEQVIKLAESALDEESDGAHAKKGEVEAYLVAARQALVCDPSEGEEG